MRFILRTITLALAVCLIPSAFAEPPKIKVNLTDNQTIKGITKISVLFESEINVETVSLVIDGEIRETDKSTPYEFNWDTIDDSEGEHAVQLRILSSDDRYNFDYKIIIDNELTKGTEYFLSEAQKEVSESNWNTALLSARTVLKIDPSHLDAKIIVSRAYLGLNNIEDARIAIEYALIDSPDSIPGQELLSAILIRKAFTEKDRDKEKRAFIDAIKARHKSLDLQIEQYKDKPDSIDRIQLLMNRGYYIMAIDTLKKKIGTNYKNSLDCNRLLYAYVSAGQYDEANKLSAKMLKAGSADEYTHSLLAVTYSLLGDQKASDDQITVAASISAGSPVVKFAQLYMASQRKNWGAVQTLINSLLSDNYNTEEVYYYQVMLLSSQGEWETATEAMKKALLLEPAMEEMFIQRGYEYLNAAVRESQKPPYAGQDKTTENLLKVSTHYFSIAYTTNESSPSALIGNALINAAISKPEDALIYADGALKTASERIWVLVACAAVYENCAKQLNIAAGTASRNGDPETASKLRMKSAAALAKAAETQLIAYKRDKNLVTGQTPYTYNNALTFVLRWGRPPVFLQPSASLLSPQ